MNDILIFLLTLVIIVAIVVMFLSYQYRIHTEVMLDRTLKYRSKIDLDGKNKKFNLGTEVDINSDNNIYNNNKKSN